MRLNQSSRSSGHCPAITHETTFRHVGVDDWLAAGYSQEPEKSGADKSSESAPQDHTHTNALARETSPYLLMHAHNPVNWYAWNEETLAKAKTENKPIFLSIGYSSCHWCHVMERESFLDEEIAEFLNQHFICIKVDREERPDVDEIYMESLHTWNRLSGSRRGGGWPLSMFLLPDGRPFFGGTYFPARTGDRGQTVGFLTVVQKDQRTLLPTILIGLRRMRR